MRDMKWLLRLFLSLPFMSLTLGCALNFSLPVCLLWTPQTVLLKATVIKRPFIQPLSLMGLSLCTMLRSEPQKLQTGPDHTHADGRTDGWTDRVLWDINPSAHRTVWVSAAINLVTQALDYTTLWVCTWRRRRCNFTNTTHNNTDLMLSSWCGEDESDSQGFKHLLCLHWFTNCSGAAVNSVLK